MSCFHPLRVGSQQAKSLLLLQLLSDIAPGCHARILCYKWCWVSHIKY